MSNDLFNLKSLLLPSPYRNDEEDQEEIATPLANPNRDLSGGEPSYNSDVGEGDEDVVEDSDPTNPGIDPQAPSSAPLVGRNAAAKYFQAKGIGTVPAGTGGPIEEPTGITSTQNPQQEKYQQMLEQLKTLQARESGSRSNNAVLMGMNQIAQAVAHGYGGKIGDGMAQVKKLDDDASKPVDDLLKQFKLAKETQATNIKPTQQSSIFGRVNGKLIPLVYDPNIGRYKNGLNGEVVPEDTQILRNVLQTDAFGNKISFGSEGVQIESESKRPNATPEQLNELDAKGMFNPDDKQIKAVDAYAKRLDGLTKDMNEKIDAATRINAALDGDLETALAVVQTQMPRLAGEVGNLNTQEQAVWNGANDMQSKLYQFGSTLTTSKLLDSNRELLRKTLLPFLQGAIKSKEGVIETNANGIALNHKVPASFFKRVYGQTRTLSPRMEEVAAGNTANPEKKKAPKAPAATDKKAEAVATIQEMEKAKQADPSKAAAYDAAIKKLKEKFGI